MMDILEDAIFYAAQRATELGADGSEYVTLVYEKPDGTYGFTEPQGGASDRKVKAKLRFPKGSTLMALVHNHPELGSIKERDAAADAFSVDDIFQARELGIPSYITFGNDMRVSRFDPARTRGNKGDPFDHIPEVKPIGKRIGSLLDLYQQVSQ